ncbi:MAG: polysaccharide deacetylase family protein [Ilumatobacteraceae bacterium]
MADPGETMQRWKRVVGTGISAVHGVKSKFSEKPKSLRVLMYHSIGSPDLGELDGLYRLTAQRFESHLSFLRARQSDSHHVVHPLTDLAQVGLSITFDDGYRDNLEIAAPLLVEFGFPFHVFVNPSFVLSGADKYLTVPSLRELASIPGASVGAHGYSHRRLTDCTPAELEYELVASKQWIESVIGRAVTTMAYPHGAVNDQVRQAAAKAGYAIAATSKFGSINSSSDRFALERTEIWSTDTVREFRSKLSGNWDWMSRRT